MEIPTDVLMNVILVNENVRPAMLIQPQDYREYDETGPITSNILLVLKEKFPKLIFSGNYELYQGIIVSKKDYNHQNISLQKMGKILGYPCYLDFNPESDKERYSIDVRADYNGKSFQLLANICFNPEILPEFEIFAKNAETVLHKNGLFCKVNVILSVVPSYTSVIKELMSDKELSTDFKNFINNEFWNNFTDGSNEKLPKICEAFDYSNKIHRGILIGFLLNFKHDKISPFYPLDSEMSPEVNQISNELEDYTILLLSKNSFGKRKKTNFLKDITKDINYCK